MGLDAALPAKGDRYLGILNGIDPDVWNPATEPDARRPPRRTSLEAAVAARDLLHREG